MPRILEQALGVRPADAGPDYAQTLERSAHRRLVVRKTVRAIVQGLIFVALVSVLFVRVPQVEGRSMQPHIENGDHVLINTLAYGISLGPRPLTSAPIGHGDIVAFEQGSGDERRVLLKRVIALPGESVSISNGLVSVQGAPLRETYDPILDHSTMRATIVPSETVFVLGDNRGESDDSRLFGPIPESSIIGKALLIVWPLGNVKRIR